jgi:hypothetical protein
VAAREALDPQIESSRRVDVHRELRDLINAGRAEPSFPVSHHVG